MTKGTTSPERTCMGTARLLLLFALVIAFHRSAGQFILFDSGNSGLPNDMVDRIDARQPGVIWAATEWGGLARFDGSTWTVYDTTNSPLTSNTITDVATDALGHVWVSAVDVDTNVFELYHFDGTTWTDHTASLDDPTSYGMISSLFVDPANDDLIVSYFSTVGIYDGTDWSFHDESTSPWPTPALRGVARDPDGILWVVTDQGFLHWDGAWTVNSSAGQFSDLEIAPNGDTWMVKSTAVARHSGGTWTYYQGNGTELHTAVQCVVVDNDGVPWVGHSGNGGLSRYNGTTWEYFDANNTNFPGGAVYDMAVDPSGALWLATTVGLLKLDGPLGVHEAPGERQVHLFPNPADGQATLQYPTLGPDVMLSITDGQGRLFLGPQRLNGAGEHLLDLRTLAPGPYHFRLSSDRAVVSRKLIIARGE